MPEEIIEETTKKPMLFNRSFSQTRKQRDNRHRNHVQVREGVGVSNIKLVKADFIGEYRFEVVIHKTCPLQKTFFIAIKHRGRACDPRFYGEDFFLYLLRPVLGNVVILWSGSNDAHLTFEHIPELR